MASSPSQVRLFASCSRSAGWVGCKLQARAAGAAAAFCLPHSVPPLLACPPTQTNSTQPKLNFIHAGGKWTTYRLMAQDAIDRAIAEGGLRAEPCATTTLKLIGSGAWCGGGG